MKRLFSKNHNAMLMACCRLGLRPNSVFMETAIFVTLIGMVFLFRVDALIFPKQSFAAGSLPFILIIQGIILISGMARIIAAVRREQVSGTLELYRLSPQSRLGIVLGLLVGAPVLEWLLALSLVPPIMIIGVSIGLPFYNMLIYECSFFLGALVIGQCFMTLILFQRMGKGRLLYSNYLSNLAGLVIFFILIKLASANIVRLGLGPYSPSYHAFAPYALSHLVQSILERSGGKAIHHIPALTAFALQVAVHVPVFCLAVWVAIRNLKYPERPSLSKAQAYAVVSVAYALYVAELFNNSRMLYHSPELILFLSILTAALGLAMVYVTTPDYRVVIRERYLYRTEDNKCWWNYLFSDGSSATCWLIGYFLLTCMAIIPVMLLVYFNYGNGHLLRFAAFLPLVCALALAQVACFSEFFRVLLFGGFRRSILLFPILLFLFWVAVPVVAIVLTQGRSSFAYWTSLVLSPIFSGVRILSHIWGDYMLGEPLRRFVSPLIWGIVLNLSLACAFGYMASRLRKKIESDFSE